MRTKKTKVLPFKRKRQGKTDYRLRLRLVSSKKPRLVVRRSLQDISVQIIVYSAKGDKVVATANGKELKKAYGWNGAVRNTPGAYLVGYLAAIKAKKAKVTEAIVDIGLRRAVKGAIVLVAAKGALDAGLKIPLSEEILPADDRIKGKHMKHSLFDKVLENIKAKA